MSETVVQSNANYISVILREESFADGAHPAHNMETFNYDVKHHRELTVTDFVSLKDASTDSQTQLLSDLGEGDMPDQNTQSMIQEGTDPANPDNFSKFTFDGDKVTIYFGEYQVAPYVFGEPEVKIPLKNK